MNSIFTNYYCHYRHSAFNNSYKLLSAFLSWKSGRKILFQDFRLAAQVRGLIANHLGFLILAS